MSRLREMLEIAEANNGFVSSDKLPGSKGTRSQTLYQAKKRGYLVNVGWGKYRLTSEGQEFLVDNHYKKLEETRSTNYPAWYTPTEKVPAGTASQAPDERNWETMYFEQVEFMKELLRNLTGNKQ